MASKMAQVDNWDGAAALPPSTGSYMDVTCPMDGSVIAKVAVSGAADVDAAVARAKVGLPPTPCCDASRPHIFTSDAFQSVFNHVLTFSNSFLSSFLPNTYTPSTPIQQQ